MKKALVILLALSMVFAAFADEPAVTNAIAEFKGDATVTWGVDLDAGKTGFKNEESASLKFTLIGKGDKTTTGEGVWGDIKVKIGDEIQYKDGSWNGNAASIDYAKIHLSDMLAIGIRSGDVAVGGYKPVLAAHSEGHSVGEAGGLLTTNKKKGGASLADADLDDNGNVPTEKRTSQGITLEVSLPDLLDLNVDFRSDGSYKAGADGKKAGVAQVKPVRIQYTNNYGIAADLNVKAVKDLSLKAGFGMDFYKKTTSANEANDWGFFAAADYKLGLDKLGLTDTMYLKPQVGFTVQNSFDATTDKMVTTNKIVAAIFVGWGAENQDTNIKYLDKKVSDGFSVATDINLTPGKYSDESAKPVAIPLCVGVWDSTFVENLKAGAELHVADVANFGKNFTTVFEFTYKLKDVIAPTFGLKFANSTDRKAIPNDKEWDETKSAFNLYAAVAYTGIANTTFTLAYESGNLVEKDSTKPKAGTINLSAKVSF